MPRRPNKRRFCTVIDMCRIVVRERQAIQYRQVHRSRPDTALVEVQDFSAEDFAFFSIGDAERVPEPMTGWTAMDVQTAADIVRVYDAGNDNQKMRLNALDASKMINACELIIRNARQKVRV